jgi:hypothetical protein
MIMYTIMMILVVISSVSHHRRHRPYLSLPLPPQQKKLYAGGVGEIEEKEGTRGEATERKLRRSKERKTARRGAAAQDYDGNGSKE